LLSRIRFNCIPCQDKSKIPSVTWKEWQNVRCQIPIIKNYAVLCGKLSNVIVIDIDSPEITKEIFESWDNLLNKTLVVQTGSGGYHVYIEYEQGQPTMRLDNSKGHHIDIQSEGTYVVGPGSIHPNGNEYKIISRDTNVMKMTDLQGFLDHLKGFGFNTENSGLLPFKDMARSKIVKGNRNASCFKYVCNLLDNVSMDPETARAELIRFNTEQVKPSLPESELKLIFNSAIKKVSPHVKFTQEGPKQVSVREIGPALEGQLITFTARILAVEEKKTFITECDVECNNGDNKIHVKAGPTLNIKFPNCRKHGSKCIAVENTAETSYVCTALVQEDQDKVESNQPLKLYLKVTGDNVYKAIFGKRKKITGYFRSVIFHTKHTQEYDPYIFVTELEDVDDVKEESLNKEEISKFKFAADKDPTEFKSTIVNSFAKHIEGYTFIKESLLLQIAGGSTETRRQNINIFLMGNPSKGKSELLKETTKLLTKAAYIVMVNASKAGLGYSLVKLPDGTSIPQAGVLVLCDGGQVSLDELDKAQKEDRDSLLECMEQQTVTYLKSGSGVGITNDARVSILAGANPKYGTWDLTQSIIDNVDIEDYLLTRFDMMWCIIETSDIMEDKIADKILNINQDMNKKLLDTDTLKRYINYIRTLNPKLTESAKYKIKAFYKNMTKITTGKDTIQMTARQLEGLIRLSTAHAKLMLKDIADETDVDVSKAFTVVACNNDQA